MSGGGWLLPLLIGVPLAAALVLLAVRPASDRSAAVFGTVVAAGELGLAALAVEAAAPYGRPGPRLQVTCPGCRRSACASTSGWTACPLRWCC